MISALARERLVAYHGDMRQLLIACASILAMILVAAALYVKLPGYQAVGLTLFGACLAGLGAFGVYIAIEDKKRSHH